MNLKKLQILFVILTFAFAGYAQSQIDLSQPIPIDKNVKIGKLDNGLTYYIRKNSKPENKVELRLAVNAGSILERDDQRGLAHFVEHMAFNGSKNFDKNELISYLQSIGVKFGSHLNAYTSFDETVYMLSIPTDKPGLLDKGLLVLSDWAGGITFDQEEIDKERGVVLEELRVGTGANQRMRDKYFPVLFKGSQYAERLPIGTEENLKTFKRESLVDFYEDWYRPDLMAIVAVGDFDPAEMEAKIKAQFSGLKAKRTPETERTAFSVPDQMGTDVVITKDKEASFTMVQVVNRIERKEVKTLNDRREEMLRGIFSEMLNQRIDELGRKATAPYLFGFSGFGGLVRSKGAYSSSGASKPSKSLESIEALVNENRRAELFGFNESEFERYKIRYLKDLENSYNEKDKTKSTAFAPRYVSNFLRNSRISGVEFDLEFARKIIPTIKLEEINALAKDTISDENRVVIITGPDKPEIAYPTKAEVLKTLQDSQTAELKPFNDNVSTDPLIGELKSSASIVKESFDSVNGFTHWTLSNGINVWIKKTDFKDNQILMRGFSPGGSSVIPDSKIIPGTFAEAVAGQSGLGKMTQVQLSKKLTGKTAGVSARYSGLYETINGSSTPKDLETMLQLLILRFTDVNFDEAEFESFKATRKAILANVLSNPEFYFSNEIREIENQGNPRYFNSFDPKIYENLDLAELKAIYNDRFADASDYNFAFVGNIDPEISKPLILKYLGNLPIIGRKETWKKVGPEPLSGPFKKVIYKGEDEKSSVSIRVRTPTKFDSSEAFIISSMGKLYRNKLLEILREEKGGVYGVGASAGMGRIPREYASLSISFPCGPENVDALTDAAITAFKKIQNGEIDQKDVDKIIEAELVDLRERNKDNSTWLNRITYTLMNNVPIPTNEEFKQRAKALSIEEIQRVANQYFDIEKRREYVLMPEKYEPKK